MLNIQSQLPDELVPLKEYILSIDSESVTFRFPHGVLEFDRDRILKYFLDATYKIASNKDYIELQCSFKTSITVGHGVSKVYYVSAEQFGYAEGAESIIPMEQYEKNREMLEKQLKLKG